MARIRTVKPEFFQHEELGELPFAARLLAIGLLQLADGHGRLRWVPKQIEAHCFPWDEVDVESLATGLESAGMFIRYQVGPRRFGCFPNFRKHQRITGKEAALDSKYPHPDEATTNEVNARVDTGETSGCFPEKHLGAQEQGTGNREQGNNVASSVATVWAHYSELRRQKRKISDKARDLIRSRLKKHSAEDLCLVVDWSREAPTSIHLRENDRGQDYTRWSTIFAPAHFDSYLEQAEEWRDDGRPSANASQEAQWTAWFADPEGECAAARATYSSLKAMGQAPSDVAAWLASKPGAPPVQWLRRRIGGER